MSFAIQEALYAKLKNGAAIQSIVGDRVFDDIGPTPPAMPYITFGEFIEIPFDTQTSTGRDVEVTIDTWSKYRGRKETAQLLDAIKETLHRQPLAITGGTLVMMHVEQMMSFMDSDGLTRHGVARVRVVAE